MSYWQASDGSRIYFETYGGRSAASTQKDTLLLLPGLLGSVSSQWRAFIEPLAVDYFLILADLRGHGRSENASATIQPEQVADDLFGLLDHLNIQNVHLAGYSFGGYVGLMMHLRHPKRITTLLMHATKFYWTAVSVAKMRQQLNPDTISEKVPNYANQLALEHGASRWRPLVRQASDIVAFIVQNGLTEGMVGHAQCPVLISVGDRDELIPLQEALRLSRAAPNGALVVLPDVRHPFLTVNLIPLLPTMQAFHNNSAGSRW